MGIFYKPQDGVAADFIPFLWDDGYHLFYLKDYRDPAGHGDGTPWFQLVSRDFVSFEDWGESLPRGPQGSQDLWVFTGSAIEAGGTFHIFYTGHNGHFQGTGKPIQAVMHATSPDMRTWTKDESFLFFAPEGYEPDDWRDPFVWWNEQTGEWWMLLAARKTSGPSRHRGCLALAASPDLKTWEVRDPFWAPDEWFTHECPDLFRIGDWWYLVYSTFTDRSVTHYRMARDLAGPWLCPPNNTFDGRAFYAAKTAGDDNERYVFGWLPTREGDRDEGGWQWGGNLVAHQVLQSPDGTLTVRPPQTVVEAFDRPVELAPQPVLGSWEAAGDSFHLPAVGRFTALTLGYMPAECLLEAEVTFGEWTSGCGFLLRVGEGAESYYQVRLEPANQRVVMDRWPRPGDQPFMLERPVAMAAGEPVSLRAFADGTCLVVYVNDQVALSCRMYNLPEGDFGLFATEGDVRFDNVSLRVRG